MASPRIIASATSMTSMTVLLFAANADGNALRVIGGRERQVRIVGMSGTVPVVVRNVSRHPFALTATWIATDGSAVVRLTHGRHTASSAGVALVPRSAYKRPIAAGTSRRMSLTLRLRRDQAPSDSGGRLTLGTVPARGPPSSLVVRTLPADLRFDPSRLQMRVNEGCWLITLACGRDSTLIVRGRDAVGWARSHPALGSSILHGDRGTWVRVEFRAPVVRSGHVEVTVHASHLGHAGEFTGGLPLDPTGLRGPALGIDMDVRFALPIAAAMVFAGALIGGFFRRRFEIRRQRQLLELELRAALDRYDKARSGGKPRSFSLDRWLEPRRTDRAATVPFPGTRGVSAVLWYIRTARDDADFRDEADRVHELIGHIERWLTLEPVADDAARLLTDDLPEARRRRRFDECQCCRDLKKLRVAATTPPIDDATCERLVAALVEQGVIVAQAKVVWSLMLALEQRQWTPAEGAMIERQDVLAIEERFPSRSERTEDQTAVLRAELEAAEKRLRDLLGGVAAPTASQQTVDRTRQIGETLQRRDTAIERKTADISPLGLRLRSTFHVLALKSLAWTFGLAMVAATAYTVAVYSPTWGSVTDFASAFTAGFLTETVVSWARLPAFESWRIRRSNAGPAPREVTGEHPGPPADEAGEQLDAQLDGRLAATSQSAGGGL